MKKLMFMLATVACAAALQAACVVNWNTGTLYAPGAGGTGWSADPIADGTSGVLATLLVGTGYSGDTLTGLVSFGSGATATDVVGSSLFNSTSADLADDTVYYGQVIVTFGDSTLTSQIVSFETSALSGSAEPYFSDGGMFIEALPGQTLDATYGAFGSAGWVPEPTSGLLMLVGLGALALRRRKQA